MRKLLLTYSSFVIACTVVIAAFITATTYFQLVGAILLYPLLVYFAFKAFPRKTRISSSKNSTTSVSLPVKSAEGVTETKRESIGISDIDKRVCLKLIGGAGVSLFLFSIFNKRAEGLFFKSLPASGVSGSVSLKDIAGNKIDPVQSQPTDGYRISEIDENFVTFYGFTNKDGAWFVMREETDTGSFRYSRGDSNFPNNWANREKLKYDYFSNIFRP